MLKESRFGADGVIAAKVIEMSTCDKTKTYLRRTVRICAAFSWTNSSCASRVLRDSMRITA
jgi:hypothetical protein